MNWKAAESNDFLAYANKVCELKKIHLNAQVLEDTKRSLMNAFKSVYQAVAFDIDGTVTDERNTCIDKQIIESIMHLLEKGIPVFFVTGRSEKSIDLLSEMRKTRNLSDMYFLKLYFIIFNGTVVMAPKIDNRGQIIYDELVVKKFDEPIKHRLLIRVAELCKKYDCNYIEKQHVVRITSHKGLSIRKIHEDLKREFSELIMLFSKYNEYNCLDVTCATKTDGLAIAAKHANVQMENIVRIGDQGQIDGNDYDLLNVECGFSVGNFSNEARSCFPVLDEIYLAPLKHSKATSYLLSQLHIFPPICIKPHESEQFINRFRDFERFATKCAREESETINQRLRVRLHHILKSDSNHNVFSLVSSDIYDQYSGGVTFHDWEIIDLSGKKMSSHSDILDIFKLSRCDVIYNVSPQAERWMFTDTKIILRGPLYYSQFEKFNKNDGIEYLKRSKLFVEDAIKFSKEMVNEPETLFNFKVCLGVYDNVRNILLRRLNYLFYIESINIDINFDLSMEYYNKLVVRHTKLHHDFLIDSNALWKKNLLEYNSLLKNALRIIKKADSKLLEQLVSEPETPTEDKPGYSVLYKWREADDFIQNIAAAQLTFQGLRNNLTSNRILAISLAYGGCELGAIFAAVSLTQGIKIDCGIVRFSHYAKETLDLIKKKKANYIELLNNRLMKHCGFSPSKLSDNTQVILCDDNITTGITLQVSHDFVVSKGYNVIGCLIVRYAGLNRFRHMLIDQASPNPDLLFSLIRGLVAPSPYTRLLYNGKTQADIYKDHDGKFDKFKDRIKTYIRKNNGSK